MRVPIRKGGEFTNLPTDPCITQAKYSQLKQQLAALKRQRPEAIAEVRRLAELGDFSENAAYQMAKGRLRNLNDRFDELQKQINSAIIIKPPKNGNKVVLGSKAKVKINGKINTFLILGSAEADLSKNIISHNSPVGSALIGKKAGESFIVKLENGEFHGKIIKIGS